MAITGEQTYIQDMFNFTFRSFKRKFLRSYLSVVSLASVEN